MTASTISTLVGRVDLLRQLEGALWSGVARPTLVRGDPGIGKTVLLEELVQRSRAHSLVLEVSAVQSEAILPYGALHQLLAPVFDRVESLPPELRSALRGAFGFERNDQHNHSQVTSAVHALLVSIEGPVVVHIDDLHWFDHDSLAVLQGVVRRADCSRLRLVATLRRNAAVPFDDAQLIEVGPLPDDEAVRLLDRRWPRLAPQTKAFVLASALGNPLALVELPEAIASGHEYLSPVTDLCPEIPLSRRLARAFGWYSHDLPPTTAALMLVAAANTGCSTAEAMSATSAIMNRPVTDDDLEPALRHSLVELEGGTLRFRHPLIRAATLYAASGPARRAAHRALANLLETEPDRRAWHRSQVVTVDGELAGELEAAAHRAQRGGAPETALILLERAADRSEDRADEHRQAALGAEIAVYLGDRATGMRLLARVPSTCSDSVTWLSFALDEQNWELRCWCSDQVQSFTAAMSRAAHAGRPDFALRMLDRVSQSPHRHIRLAALETARQLVGRYDREPMTLMFSALEPRSAGAVGRSIAKILKNGGSDPETARICAAAAGRAYDFDLGVEVLPAVARQLTARGQRAGAGQALSALCWSRMQRGEVNAAEWTARQAQILARDSHDCFWKWVPGLVLAWIDAIRTDEREPGARIATRPAAPRSGTVDYPTEALQQVVAASAELASGRYSQCAERLENVLAGDPHTRWWGFSEYVESCVRLAEPERARPRLSDLKEVVTSTDSRHLADQLAFAEALLAPDTRTEEASIRALDTEPLANPLLRARLALLHGMRLRRRRHVREARSRLEEARILLIGIGPTRWDAEVARELSACGVLAARRGLGSETSELTPQEQQVAVLAEEGLSNREISLRLAISPRTVSTHLYRAFGKLGIAGRHELALRTPV